MSSQSSSVQQIMAGSPNNWWNFNNMKSQISQHQQETATSDYLFPQFLPILVPPSSISSSASSSWNDNQKFPESLSQLLLAGLVGEEDKSTLAKKLENWDEQLLDHASSCSFIQVEHKRPPANSYIYGHGNIDKFHHHQAVAAEPTWSQTMPVSSPKSSVTTMRSTMVEFSNNMLDSKHPPPDHSSEVGHLTRRLGFNLLQLSLPSRSELKEIGA